MTKNEVIKILANRLEELTERKRDIDYKLSDKKQAEQMDIPYRTFIKYKSGESECPISNIVKMAEYYGVSTDYLLGRTRIDTADIKLQGVCKYTGLTEKTINALVVMTRFDGRHGKSLNYVANDFIASEEFYDFVIQLVNFGDVYCNSHFADDMLSAMRDAEGEMVSDEFVKQFKNRPISDFTDLNKRQMEHDLMLYLDKFQNKLDELQSSNRTAKGR